MVGLWAYNAPAILEAAKSKNAAGRIKIVSFDEYPDTLTAIERGEIYATVVQDPYNFGFKSVELMAEMAKIGRQVDRRPTSRSRTSTTGWWSRKPPRTR